MKNKTTEDFDLFTFIDVFEQFDILELQLSLYKAQSLLEAQAHHVLILLKVIRTIRDDPLINLPPELRKMLANFGVEKSKR